MRCVASVKTGALVTRLIGLVVDVEGEMALLAC